MRLPLIIGGVVVVLASILVTFLYLRAPQPEVILPAEVIWTVGPLNITNTLISAWFAMLVLIVLAFLATRSMSLMPGSLQNFVEAVVEFLYDQCVEIVGEAQAKKFFAVCATIFLFIIVSNWMGLLPFFNAVGRTEDVGHEIMVEIIEHEHDGHAFEEEEHFEGFIMRDSGGVAIIQPNDTDVFEFEVAAGEEPGVALDRYIIHLAEQYTDFEVEGEEAGATEGEGHAAPPAEEVEAAFAALQADPDAPKFLPAEGEEHITSPALGLEFGGLDFPGYYLALNVPLFRSTFSDANNTIAIALLSFFFIQFWAFQAVGFGYLGKFFNFSSPIMFFVGFLELISEFIKIISFAFRLLGNIFAGEVLVLMLTFLVPLVIVDLIYALELFVGFIQAAVFALLTLVFAAGAAEHHGEEHAEAH